MNHLLLRCCVVAEPMWDDDAVHAMSLTSPSLPSATSINSAGSLSWVRSIAWVGAEYPVIRGPNGLADTVYSGHHESNIAVDIGLNHFTSMIAYRYVKIKKVNDCILETIRQLNGITVFINCDPFAVNWSADHPHEHSFHGESRRPYLRGGV